MAVRDEHVSHPPRWYANNPVCRLTRHWACGFSLLVPRRRKCQRRNRGGGGGGGVVWGERCRPTLSAVSPVPHPLCFKGERSSLGRRKHDRSRRWRRSTAERRWILARSIRVSRNFNARRAWISKFSGAKIMASDGIPPGELSENF